MEASERRSVQGSSEIQSRSKGWADRQVGSIGGGAWRPSLSVRGRGTGAGGGKDAWAEKRARRDGKPRVSTITTLMSAITNDSIYPRLIGLTPTASPALARKTLVSNLDLCSSTTLKPPFMSPSPPPSRSPSPELALDPSTLSILNSFLSEKAAEEEQFRKLAEQRAKQEELDAANEGGSSEGVQDQMMGVDEFRVSRFVRQEGGGGFCKGSRTELGGPSGTDQYLPRSTKENQQGIYVLVGAQVFRRFGRLS